jgi:hypothetical protein
LSPRSKVLWLGTLPGLIHRERPDFAYTLRVKWNKEKRANYKLFPHKSPPKSICRSASIAGHQTFEFLMCP